MKIIKKVTAILVTAIIILICASPVLATTNSDKITISLVSSRETVTERDSFKLTITVKNDSGYALTDIIFILNLDISKLNYNGITATYDDVKVTSGGTNAYKLSYSANGTANRPSLPNGDSFVYELTFSAKEGISPGNVNFSISDGRFLVRTDLTNDSILSGNISQTINVDTYPNKSVYLNALSSDADIIALYPVIDGARIDGMKPDFNASVTDYKLDVIYDIPNIKFDFDLSDASASYDYITPAGIAVGTNVFKILVTAQDGTTTKTYTIVVNRLKRGETIGGVITTSTAAATTSTTTSSNNTSNSTATTTGTNGTAASTTTTVAAHIEGGLIVPDDRNGINISLPVLLAVIGAELLLFVLAFVGGYLAHKNASKSKGLTVDDLIAAQRNYGAVPSYPQEPVYNARDIDQYITDAIRSAVPAAAQNVQGEPELAQETEPQLSEEELARIAAEEEYRRRLTEQQYFEQYAASQGGYFDPEASQLAAPQELEQNPYNRKL